MTVYAVILTNEALADSERLQDFLTVNNDPLELGLMSFLTNAFKVLTHQPGIGRPMKEGLRELILERGASGYIAKYSIDRAALTVRVLRFRHQKEIGYPTINY